MMLSQLGSVLNGKCQNDHAFSVMNDLEGSGHGLF
jgi:hypothetical protein